MSFKGSVAKVKVIWEKKVPILENLSAPVLWFFNLINLAFQSWFVIVFYKCLSFFPAAENNGITNYDCVYLIKLLIFLSAAENICVTDDLKIKITDFGSAKVGTQEQDYQGWTSEYMAPEMCRAFLQSRYPSVFKNETEDFSLTGKVDVFAFGLVLQFMLEKTHTQMKFFTNGATSYTNVEDVNKLRLNIIIAVCYLLIIVTSFFIYLFLCVSPSALSFIFILTNRDWKLSLL